MNHWQPTHVVPSTGMWLWSEPDGAAPPAQQVDPGVEVQVVGTQDAWSQVVFENGFSAWVDGRELVALHAAPPPESPEARRRRPWLVAGVAAAVVAVVAVAVAGGGSDEAATNGADLVALHVPDGWARSDDGLAVAEHAADLGVNAPKGAVVRAVVVPEEGTPADQLNDFTEGVGEDVAFDDPVERTIDGFDAVSITARDAGRVHGLIATHPPGGQAVMFRIDAPASQYDSLRTVLESVPGLRLEAAG